MRLPEFSIIDFAGIQLLNVLDIILTIWALNHGYIEINPLVRPFLSHDLILPFIINKFFMTFSISIAVYMAQLYFKDRFFSCVNWFIMSIYVFALAFNLFQVIL